MTLRSEVLLSMQFKKVAFESMKLGEDAKVSKTYTRQVEENSRLTQFIGNEPSSENEHGGEPIQKKSFSGTDYLEPVSEHQKILHDYAMQVQQALNPKPESDGTENKGDFETFISKGADALIKEHPDLVKRLI